MNDKPMNYQSQISKNDGEIILNLKPYWWAISEKYLIPIAVVSYLAFILLIASGFNVPFIVIYCFIGFAVPIVGLVLFMTSAFLNEMIISKTAITTNMTDEKKSINKIPFIDFEVEILENRVKISMQNFQFSLRNIKDLPKLTEGVAELLDLEFYSNHQLRNNKEVLTYKSKRIVKPNYPSFLSFKDSTTKLQIHDITSQYRYIKIERIVPITDIIYSLPDIEERYGTEYIVKVKDVERIVVKMIQNAGMLRRQHRIIVTAFMKTSGIQTILLRTRLRKSKDELTNWRDGERVYELLKAVSNLNIPIEKEQVK